MLSLNQKQFSMVKLTGIIKKNKIISNYFRKVEKAQIKYFKNNYIPNTSKKINILPISMGDLNYLNLNNLKNFYQATFILFFGSSYIKGKLVDFLIKKKAINIHMGVSPYYRGADCNFWALQDYKPQFVGATIHYLSKGLDTEIFYIMHLQCLKKIHLITQ